MEQVGIDIGGSGVKGAVVETTTGRLLTERLRGPTPKPATPSELARPVREVFRELARPGPLGVAFPAVVTDGVGKTATSTDTSWAGTNVSEPFRDATGFPVSVCDDADAAGVARSASARSCATTQGSWVLR